MCDVLVVVVKIFDNFSDLAALCKQIADSLNFIKYCAELIHSEMIMTIVLLTMNLLF